MDLDRSDFTVSLDGNQVPIEVFIPPGSSPLELVVLLDSSGSMTEWPAAAAASALLDGLPDDTCVLLAPFNETTHPGVWGHPSDPTLRTVIAGLSFEGQTALHDALLHAFDVVRTRASRDGSDVGPPPNSPSYVDLMQFRTATPAAGRPTAPPAGVCVPVTVDGSPTRRAVAVLTDGEDTSSVASLDDVLLAAWGSNVPVFAFAAVEFPRTGDHVVRGRRPRLGGLSSLEQVSKFTGGSVIREYREARDIENKAIWRGVDRLLASLRGHYTLAVSPPPDPIGKEFATEHRVSITGPRGIDIVSAERLVLGEGMSEGAALDLALRGFQAFVSGDLPDALASFRASISMSSRLGIAHYGLGGAFAASGDWESALRSLELADTHAPWIPDLDARKAQLLMRMNDMEGAWNHVVAAENAGSDVRDLVAELERIAPGLRPAAVDAGRLRIALGQAQTSHLEEAVIAPTLLAAVGHAVKTSPSSVLVPQGQDESLVLSVVVQQMDRSTRHTSVSFEVTAEAPTGRRLARKRFWVRDFRSPAATSALVAEIQEWLSRLEQDAPVRN